MIDDSATPERTYPAEPINLDDPNAKPRWCETCNRWGLHATAFCPSKPAESHELLRWTELTDVEVTVNHDGDASKLLPIPRPSWADADEDWTDSAALDLIQYRSVSAEVALSRMNAINEGGSWYPAKLEVCAKLMGDGRAAVGVTTKKVIQGKVEPFGYSMTVAEAHQLAVVLLAAADLAVSE